MRSTLCSTFSSLFALNVQTHTHAHTHSIHDFCTYWDSFRLILPEANFENLIFLFQHADWMPKKFFFSRMCEAFLFYIAQNPVSTNSGTCYLTFVSLHFDLQPNFIRSGVPSGWSRRTDCQRKSQIFQRRQHVHMSCHNYLIYECSDAVNIFWNNVRWYTVFDIRIYSS